MKFTFTFNTKEEAELAAYCIKEQSYRLAEKAIEFKDESFRKTGDLAHKLSCRIYDAIYQENNGTSAHVTPALTADNH